MAYGPGSRDGDARYLAALTISIVIMMHQMIEARMDSVVAK